MKALKEILKVWNKEVYGEVQERKNEALLKLQEWDRRTENALLSEFEATMSAKAENEYIKWVNMEEISWRQKSRELWLNEGDRNTTYFQELAFAHRRRNCIAMIKDSNEWITNMELIKERIIKNFKT